MPKEVALGREESKEKETGLLRELTRLEGGDVGAITDEQRAATSRGEPSVDLP